MLTADKRLGKPVSVIEDRMPYEVIFHTVSVFRLSLGNYGTTVCLVHLACQTLPTERFDRNRTENQTKIEWLWVEMSNSMFSPPMALQNSWRVGAYDMKVNI